MTRLTKEDILASEPYLRKYNSTGVATGMSSRMRSDSSEDQRDLILRQNPHQKIPRSKVTDSRDSNWRDNTSLPLDEELLKEEKNYIVQWIDPTGQPREETFPDIGRAEQMVRRLDEREIAADLIKPEEEEKIIPERPTSPEQLERIMTLQPKQPEMVTPFDRPSKPRPKVVRQPGSRTVPRGAEWYRRRGMLQPGGLLDPEFKKLTPEERRRVDVEYYRTRPLRKGEEVEKWCEIRHREPQYTPTKTPTGGEGDGGDDEGGLSPEERERRKKLKKLLEQVEEVEAPPIETKSEVTKFKLPSDFVPYSKRPTEEMGMPHRQNVYEGVLKVIDHYGHAKEKEITKLLEQDYNITNPSEQLQVIEEMLDSGLIIAVKDPEGQKFKRPEYHEVIEREEKRPGMEIKYPTEERAHEEAEKLREALRTRFAGPKPVEKSSVTEAIERQGFDPQNIRGGDDCIGTEKPQPNARYPGIPRRIPYTVGMSSAMLKSDYPRFYGSDIVQQRFFPQVAYDQMPFGEAGKVRDEQTRRTSGRSETERYNTKEEIMYRCVDCKKEFGGYMEAERHIRGEHHSGFEGFTKSEQIVKQRSAEQWYQYSTKDGKRKLLGRVGIETKEPGDWNNLSEDVRKKVEVLFETEHKKEGRTYKEEVPVQGEQYGEPGESMLGRVGLGVKQREQSKGPERRPPVPRESVKSFCSLCKEEEEESLSCPLCKSTVHSDIENGVFVCPTCIFGLVKIPGQEDLEIIT